MPAKKYLAGMCLQALSRGCAFIYIFSLSCKSLQAQINKARSVRCSLKGKFSMYVPAGISKKIGFRYIFIVGYKCLQAQNKGTIKLAEANIRFVVPAGTNEIMCLCIHCKYNLKFNLL